MMNVPDIINGLDDEIVGDTKSLVLHYQTKKLILDLEQQKIEMRKEIDDLRRKVEDLKWENKGIAEWQYIATKYHEIIKRHGLIIDSNY